MISTQIDSYVKTLIRNLEMLWCVTLNDGTKVYSDYDRPGVKEHPWNRLKQYCEETGLFIIKVEAIMLGAPQTTMFENKKGLDGLFITRGVSKDIKIETGEEGPSYRQLVVGLLRNNEDIIDVKKFSWPQNQLDPFNQIRYITPENAKLMIFKNDSTKKTRKAIQVAINGDNVYC